MKRLCCRCFLALTLVAAAGMPRAFAQSAAAGDDSVTLEICAFE